MKKILIYAVMLYLLTLSINAQENFEGELTADIDGDGKTEMMQWNKFISTEAGDYFQLRVIDDDGELIWKGPKRAEDNNPYVYSALDYGISIPQLLMDIDGDGYVELLAPELQSDVSPTAYRMLRWQGNRFEILPSKVLAPKRANLDFFYWTDRDKTTDIWVSQLNRDPLHPNNIVKVSVTQYDSRKSAQNGIALIRFEQAGAKVLKWIKPLKIKQTSHKLSYYARLSSRDHFNSKGIRLNQIADILHQDRANYYKGKGDSEDSGTGYFSSRRNRFALSHMQMVPSGISMGALSRLVVNGTPLLKITIDSSMLKIEVIDQ